MDVPSILLNPKELYGEQSRTTRYKISKQLFRARMTEGTSVRTYVLKMIDLITCLGQLGFAMDGELSQNLILQSLPDSFSQFVINYHMNKLNTSLSKLLNMLKTVESHFKGEKTLVLLVDKINKKKDKKGSKKKMNPKDGISNKRMKKVSIEGTCYHYGKESHWKKNCKEYLAIVKLTIIAKSLYMIQTNLLLSILFLDFWILDTTCGSHLYKSLQELQKIKSLNKNNFELFGASEESI